MARFYALFLINWNVWFAHFDLYELCLNGIHVHFIVLMPIVKSFLIFCAVHFIGLLQDSFEEEEEEEINAYKRMPIKTRNSRMSCEMRGRRREQDIGKMLKHYYPCPKKKKKIRVTFLFPKENLSRCIFRVLHSFHFEMLVIVFCFFFFFTLLSLLFHSLIPCSQCWTATIVCGRKAIWCE